MSRSNMEPNGRSGETTQDAEPTITVDYVSIDGGNTWTLAFIVPSKIGAGFPTGDITLSFSSTLSGAPAHKTSWLYGGTLSSTSSQRPMTLLRAQDPFSVALMAALDTRSGHVDQPHTISKTSAGGQDKLYVGFNNGYGNFPCPPPVALFINRKISPSCPITS